MNIMKKIRVMVVDDSAVFRMLLVRGISTDPDIEVVAQAIDPFDASEKIVQFHPDVMTCDVQMPKMDGIEFIKKLIPQYPVPVVVVSSISNSVIDALKAGAVDFVSKPDISSVSLVKEFLDELVNKVKIASKAKVFKESKSQQKNLNNLNKQSFERKIIAIGASTGGTEAIFRILQDFPSQMPGIVITQHIPPVFSKMFAERLNNSTNLNVKEAKTGDILLPGMAILAPGDQHMKIVSANEGYGIECNYGEKVNGHRPSVDILFESVAKEAGKKAIGVILTGMGYDGAKGLLAMRRKGARTIGQDESSCVVYGMPKVAFDLGAVEKQASLDQIPVEIYRLLSESHP